MIFGELVVAFGKTGQTFLARWMTDISKTDVFEDALLQIIKIVKMCRALLLFALFSIPVYAGFLKGNDTHLKWRSAETEHFRFHYDQKLEPLAGYVAAIAESVYTAKRERYHIELTGKTDFMLRQSLDPVGWARASMNTMEIGSTDWDFPLRSTHNWFVDVVAHEFSHLISIQSGSKWHPSVAGVVFGYQDYYNEDNQASLLSLIPGTTQPNWFAEGVAQYESEQMGFDHWDAHRDMLLRLAVLSDSLLSFDRMGVFTGRDLHYELGPYTQGYGLVRYIAQKYGDEALRAIWLENARMYRMSFSASLKRVLGVDGYTLFSDWQRSLVQQYQEQVKGLGVLQTGKKLTTETAFHFHPRWDKSDTVLYYVGNNDGTRGLYMINMNDTAYKPVWKGAGLRGYYRIRQSDSAVVLASAKEKDKYGVAYYDIFLRRWSFRDKAPKDSSKQKEKRITKEANALFPDIHPAGNKVVFLREELSNFSLCFAPLDAEEPLRTEELDCPWPTEKNRPTAFGFSIYTPRYSASGDTVVFSYYDGVSRNVGLWLVPQKQFVPLIREVHDERDPAFDPAGNGIYYSSDKSGIYNIYRHDLSSGLSAKVTNVVGGAFSPSPSHNGQKLAYVGFDKNDFSVYLVDVSKNVVLFAEGGVKKDSASLTNTSDSTHVSANIAAVDTLIMHTKKTSSPDSLSQPNPNRIGADSISLIQLGTKDSTSRKTVDTHTEQLMSVNTYYPAQPMQLESYPFDGQSQPYKGIPRRMLWQPMILGQETSSSDSLATKGDSRWFAGSSLFLLDPVGKNEVSMALLVEVGNGIDYLNFSDPINPNKQFDFFTGLTNRATPLDLSLAYTYRNLTSFDYIKSSVTGETVIERQNYAIGVMGLNAQALYKLGSGDRFDDPSQQTFIALGGNSMGYSFNFYDLPFKASYYKNTGGYLTAGFYGRDPQSSPVAPKGIAAQASYAVNLASLIRENSNQETFVQDENGAIKTNFKDYTLQELDVGGDWGVGIPGTKHSSVRFSVSMGSILSWRVSDEKTDTLNSFFERSLMLRGYPYLANREDALLRGENSLRLSADLNQSIWSEIYRGFGPWFFEDLYAHFFWEAGRAWNGKLWEADIWKSNVWSDKAEAHDFYQSVGYGIKLNSRIFHNYPFTGFIELARALNVVPAAGSGTGLQELKTLDLLGIPTGATRIQMGFSLGFYNGLLGTDPRKATASYGRRMGGMR